MAREVLWSDGYWRVEREPRRWTSKARYLIEDFTGVNLSKYDKVIYKDKDTTNCTLSNLQVINYKTGTKSWIDGTRKVTQSIKSWGKYYDYCIKCGKNNSKYLAVGMCKVCYYKDYNKPRLFK